MYTPQFPYLGNQVIITSGRVTHHSYDDFIFLFGKKGVSISSPYTFTVDANEKTVIASPKIELGYQAQFRGEPLLLGKSTSIQLGFLMDAIENFSKAITEFSSEEPEDSAANIIYTAKILSEIASTVKAQLSTKCLSENTYTR